MRHFWRYSRFLAVSVLVTALAGMGCSCAVAQEADTSRRLDRVEVLPPERRPAPAQATRSDAGAESDQTPSSDSPSSGDRGSASQGTGTVSATTQSLVEGKSQISLGSTSLPSQVQEVTAQDIQQLNVRDYSDLFREVTGVRAHSYGQGEISHNFTMRGFTGSGGCDTAVFIDGVPQNTPSVSGATGKSEISWLTPETIERIEIIKGPFSALYGDFAMAGVVNIITKKSEPSPSLNSSGGAYGTFRTVGTFSGDTWVPTPYIVDEYNTVDGYRDNQQVKKGGLFNKVSVPIVGGVLSVRYNFYKSEWGAPGYLPIDWVKYGMVDPRHAINTTDGGNQTRYEWVMNYAPACGERGLYITLYKDNFNTMRYATLPLKQVARADERTYWGGRTYYNLVFGDVASLTVGGETRQDSGQTRQTNTINREFTSTTYNYDLRLANWAWFVQGQIKPAEKLKVVGGVRGDYFTLDCDNLVRPKNSGKGFPHILSPKIGAVLTPTKNLNIYANLGNGFRSPGNLEISPYSSTAKANFALPPAMIQTSDVGFNLTLFDNLYLSAEYYHTIMQREIRVVNNEPISIGDTMRKGYEAELKYYPSKEVSLFASYAWVDAKVSNPTTAGQVLVTGASEHDIKGGVTVQRDFDQGRRVIASLYYEYTSGGPNYVGTSTSPVWSPDYDVYNLKLNYEGTGWTAFLAARYQPRDLSSPYTYVASWGTKSYLSFSPEPLWDGSAGITYTFW